MKKIKTYVLTVSRTFPATHKRKGEETFFEDKILRTLQDYLEEKHGKHALLEIKDKYSINGWIDVIPKFHTIRSNYELWNKRIAEIQIGNAILSIRYWSGKPYNSKQVEICQLDKDSGIGVQKIEFEIDRNIDYMYINDIVNDYILYPSVHEICKNDGLYYDDFYDWFKNHDLSKPMAIIHFGKFRY